MFEPTESPRVFGQPLGVDFAKTFVDGLIRRAADMTPQDFARIEVYLNTSRMKRQVQHLFDRRGARMLPRMRLISDLALDPMAADIPLPVPALKRRLELSQLVRKLLDSQPDLAPRSALYDLSDSLARLLAEMQGEGVDPSAILDLDVSDASGHWQRTQTFIGIVSTFFGPDASPDAETRQRQVIERKIADWQVNAPCHPIIIAGSTGSRGATALFMDAVSRLPQGAVVLPGVDFDMPQSVWDSMGERASSEDHPQFRYRLLMDRLNVAKADILPWSDDQPTSPARNRLVSLALRPAPVTDQWLSDGPTLGDLRLATDGLTLIEAPSPRAEAETIALRLRFAVEEGRTVALITPDRMLTRRVAAALDRWSLTADDSAGQPLHLTPPGRLLRQVAAAFCDAITGETLLSLLKHPLTASTGQRGPHLRMTRELELHIRKKGPAYPTGQSLRAWADTDEKAAWAEWLAGILDTIQGRPAATVELPIGQIVTDHIAITERLAAGPGSDGSGELWNEAPGREALKTVLNLQTHADAGGDISARDYGSLIGSLLQQGQVRNPDTAHPNILFLGTLEARVQTADLVILGGLNDGSWPENPSPDPWLNRQMREKAGLLLPERQVGLSAHDFQQAICSPEVWLTRAIRSEDAETVPSRWLNRLTNLLAGLPDQFGPDALADMRNKGKIWIAQARSLSTPVGRGVPARRPSPQPPVAARPTRLSVTQVQTLIRDPYAIYARKVLGLNKLDPLVPNADAPLRGDIIHKILELFIKEGTDPTAPTARERFLALTREELDRQCPWPTVRRLWYARMENLVDDFLEAEAARRLIGAPIHFEQWGEVALDGLDMILGGKADRIDETPGGQIILYDYKTGSISTKKQQITFDKQLILEAAMVQLGAYRCIGPRTIAKAEFLSMGSGKDTPAPLDEAPIDEEWNKFLDLIRAWRDPARGYTARMAAEVQAYGGDYDHLARYGEWDLSNDPDPEPLV